MALASTSRVQMRMIEESTFGTTPGTGNGRNLRITGESLNYNIQTETSQELRSDRQTTDLVQVGASANGDTNFELSYSEFDDLLEAVLQGTWSPLGTGGIQTITATFTATTLTAASGTPFANAVPGQWIKISGAVNSQNNGYFKIVEVTSDTVLTFAASTFTAETSTADVVVSGSRLVNGTKQRSFTLEKEFSDITQFLAYRGMTASRLSLNFASGSIVTGSVGWMGKDCVRSSTTTLPGTAAPSASYDVVNAVSGVGNIMEGGAALSGTYLKSVSLDIDNALRAQDAVGTLGAVGIGAGTLSVTGRIEAYFANGDLYDKFIANTQTSLSLRAVDGAGNGYVITLPKMKYSEGTVTAGGRDQDVMASFGITGLRDSTTGSTVLIDRVGAAV